MGATPWCSSANYTGDSVSTRGKLVASVLLVLVGGLVWFGRSVGDLEDVTGEMADASVGRLPGIPRKCARDSDCAGDSLCACRGPNCSIAPDFKTTNGLNANYCWSLGDRLAAGLPIRVDAGWIVESFPDAGPFGSPEEAFAGTIPQRPL